MVEGSFPSWLLEGEHRQRSGQRARWQAGEEEGGHFASQGVTAVATLAPLADGAPGHLSLGGSSPAGNLGARGGGGGGGRGKIRERMTSVIDIVQCF